MITKGTQVRIITTNGGDITALLIENHRFTFDAVIASGNGYAIISSFRIKSIEAVA